MTRVPYEIVAMQADRIMVELGTSSSWEVIYEFWDLYNSYLEVCGWSSYEFDRETLKRVDASWFIKRKNRN